MHRRIPVICLDCNAAIAAFQNSPSPNIAFHRDRVRHFITQKHMRLVFPAIALSEYLWKADRAGLETEIRRVVGDSMFAPAFDEVTAGIAAGLGRAYAAGRGLGNVAKQTGHDRIALKADLMIVAIALQYSVQFFLTGDPGCHSVAEFSGLNSIPISSLPEPPPPSPPVHLRPTGKMKNLFDNNPD
jgi:predicted nucleic acid-binding protein